MWIWLFDDVWGRLLLPLLLLPWWQRERYYCDGSRAMIGPLPVCFLRLLRDPLDAAIRRWMVGETLTCLLVGDEIVWGRMRVELGWYDCWWRVEKAGRWCFWLLRLERWDPWRKGCGTHEHSMLTCGCSSFDVVEKGFCRGC